VGVEKLNFKEKRPKIGEPKCIPKPRRSVVLFELLRVVQSPPQGFHDQTDHPIRDGIRH